MNRHGGKKKKDRKMKTQKEMALLQSPPECHLANVHLKASSADSLRHRRALLPFTTHTFVSAHGAQYFSALQ